MNRNHYLLGGDDRLEEGEEEGTSQQYFTIWRVFTNNVVIL
jgi:hypothetical protein